MTKTDPLITHLGQAIGERFNFGIDLGEQFNRIRKFREALTHLPREIGKIAEKQAKSEGKNFSETAVTVLQGSLEEARERLRDVESRKEDPAFRSNITPQQFIVNAHSQILDQLPVFIEKNSQTILKVQSLYKTQNLKLQEALKAYPDPRISNTIQTLCELDLREFMPVAEMDKGQADSGAPGPKPEGFGRQMLTGLGKLLDMGKILRSSSTDLEQEIEQAAPNLDISDYHLIEEEKPLEKTAQRTASAVYSSYEDYMKERKIGKNPYDQGKYTYSHI